MVEQLVRLVVAEEATQEIILYVMLAIIVFSLRVLVIVDAARTGTQVSEFEALGQPRLSFSLTALRLTRSVRWPRSRVDRC